MSSRANKKRAKPSSSAQQQDDDAATAAAASLAAEQQQQDDEIPQATTTTSSKKSRTSAPSAAARQLQDLEDQLKLAREGKHPQDLCDKLGALDQTRQKDVKRAGLVRELKLKEVQAHHDFLVQEANNSFAAKKTELQLHYCGEIEDKIKQLTGGSSSSGSSTGAVGAGASGNKDQSSSSSSGKRGGGAGNVGPPRRPRSKSLEDEGGGGEDEQGEEQEGDDASAVAAGGSASSAAEKPVPKKSLRLLVSKVGANSNLSLDAFVLANKEDIQSDLERIHASWVKRSSSSTSTTASTENHLVQVQDGNKLLVVGSGLVLEKGSQVSITRRGLEDEILATITKITANEITIKQLPSSSSDDNSSASTSGLSARIPVSQLKSGRCALKPYQQQQQQPPQEDEDQQQQTDEQQQQQPEISA